jgi:hypothetical protein
MTSTDVVSTQYSNALCWKTQGQQDAVAVPLPHPTIQQHTTRAAKCPSGTGIRHRLLTVGVAQCITIPEQHYAAAAAAAATAAARRQPSRT